ncbi:MAG: hypothetical protein COA33_000410 [Fluviicola sp.]|nr:hypothetical protein [Fluviicola sp.]
MKALILFTLLTSTFLTISLTNTSGEEEKEAKKERTMADLTSDEKKEAIAYMLSTGSCEWEGIKLYGKVQFVSSFADIKVKYVTSFPDIKVKFVTSFPDDCGEWQVVESFPDFKVQVVESFPDLKIQTVESFPGM